MNYTYYEILGISETATLAEIKTAYYNKIIQLLGNIKNNTYLTSIFQLNEAYYILSNKDSRKDYDSILSKDKPEHIINNNYSDYDEIGNIDWENIYKQAEFVNWLNKIYNYYFKTLELYYLKRFTEKDINTILQLSDSFIKIITYEKNKLINNIVNGNLSR